jgi:hypothetical protein
VAQIGPNKGEASNLLKLKRKINNKLVCYFFNSRTTSLFVTLQMAKQLGIKIK